MIKNAVAFSQPLNSHAYNNYLSQKTQNPNANNPVSMQSQIQAQMQQMQTPNSMQQMQMPNPMGQTNNNLFDAAGFASELRSHKTVSAIINVSHPKSSLAPTLAEKGATIRSDGNIIMSEKNTNLVQKNDNVSMQNSDNTAPLGISKQNTQQQNLKKTEQNELMATQTAGNPINGRSKLISVAESKNSQITLNGMRVFSLDNRSLGVLNRISEKKSTTPFNINGENRQRIAIQKNKETLNKTTESNENFSQIGKLSAQYESAQKGSSVIGYDRNGGTSYGTYQISSKAGTFDEFLNFLDKEAPKWSQQLRDAGKPNTGGRTGAVPDAWKKLCTDDPQKMKNLEHDFIIQSHYEPVASHVEEKWKGDISPALREVIFSTAVQHGVRGAKHVFNQALANTPNVNTNNVNASPKGMQESALALLMENFTQGQSKNKRVKEESTTSLEAQETLIKNIYAHRGTKFASSTLQVQESAKNRFIHEQREALSMLG